MASVEVSMPGVDEGQEVEIPLLGVFSNGSTNEVADWQVLNWESATGQTWPDNGTLSYPSKSEVKPVVNEYDLQRQIEDAQSKRSPEQVASDEKESIAAQLAGNVRGRGAMTDGQVIEPGPEAPVVTGDNPVPSTTHVSTGLFGQTPPNPTGFNPTVTTTQDDA